MGTPMCLCADVWGDGEEWEGKTATGGLFEQKNISGGSSIIPDSRIV